MKRNGPDLKHAPGERDLLDPPDPQVTMRGPQAIWARMVERARAENEARDRAKDRQS